MDTLREGLSGTTYKNNSLKQIEKRVFGTRRTGNESTFQFVSAGTFKERLPAEQYSTEPTRGDVHRIAAPRRTEFSLISWVEA